MKVREAMRLNEEHAGSWWQRAAAIGNSSIQPCPTVTAAAHEIREAIRFHLTGLREDGLPVPEPTSIADYVEA